MEENHFRLLRQGHVIEISGVGELSGTFVVVSQSCDVVQPKRELVQLAPLIQLSDEVIHRTAVNKENPRYPLIATADGGYFADLAQIVSVPKGQLEGPPSRHSLSLEDARDAREFGLAVARWFGRFAVPDEVQPWLEPVQSLIRSKYDKPASPLGQVMQQVTEVRVEAEDWSVLPVSLTVHVIVKAGSVPTIPEDADLSQIGTLPSDLDAICAAILVEQDPVRRTMLWATFADALASRCSPRTKNAEDPVIRDAVQSIKGELSSDDEFPLSKVRRSEQLDIEFLSDPTPF
jgi:hypothetical protein